MRFLTWMLAAMLGLMILAGCGELDSERPEPQEEEQQEQNETPDNTFPEPETFAGQRFVLMVFSYGGSPSAGWNKWEFQELYHGLHRMTDAEIVVATTSAHGVKGLRDRDWEEVEVARLLDYDVEDFDAVFIVGGGGTRDYYECEDTLGFMQDYAALERPLAGVCSGVTIISKAGLLEGRDATTDDFYQSVIEEGGANYIGSENMVVDEFIWTFKAGAEHFFLRQFLPVYAAMIE